MQKIDDFSNATYLGFPDIIYIIINYRRLVNRSRLASNNTELHKSLLTLIYATRLSNNLQISYNDYWYTIEWVNERQKAGIKSKVEELEEINQWLRNRDKNKDNAVAQQLSDQVMALTAKIQEIEQRQQPYST